MLRSLSRCTKLYTEMIVDETIIYNSNIQHFLGFDSVEHPISCQLGGSNPENLRIVARKVEEWGYDEINFNVGCPSKRVSKHLFGARLMLNPPKVFECVNAMQESCNIPVTVKCRLGEYYYIIFCRSNIFTIVHNLLIRLR